MGFSPTPTPELLDTLRAATLSDDGLTITLNGQLDRELYKRVNNALERYGAKWNRKAQAHVFTQDFRPHLEALMAGGRIGEAVTLPPKNPLDFYATPEAVIREMCKRIWPWPADARFLEPSAGEGAIADFLKAKHDTVMSCLEIDEGRSAILRAKGHSVLVRDFLTFTPETPYDYVLMNPPFTSPDDKQAYITHIEHALTCLKPGGDLVAIVPQGYSYGSTKRVAAFREACEAIYQSPAEPLAPDAFKASGTSVATCLIHLTKPQEAIVTAAEPTKARKPRSKKTEVPSAQPSPTVQLGRDMETVLGAYSSRRNLADLVSEADLGHYVLAVIGDHQRLGCVIDIESEQLVCLGLGGGEFGVSHRDYNVTSIVPAGMLDVGDIVFLQTREGLWRITGKEPGGIYACEQVDNPSETSFTPLSGTRIVQRKSMDAVRRDLGIYEQKTPVQVATPTPTSPATVTKEEGLLTVVGTSAQVFEVLKQEDNPFPVTEAALDAQIEGFDEHAPDPLEQITFDQVPAAASILVATEIPGTPTLFPELASSEALTEEIPETGSPVTDGPAEVTPGTLGVVEAPLGICIKSPCNVRTHYVEQKIVELAAGMKVDGQLQECVGRWNAKGELEIVAGETRRRAQVLREEQGEVGLTLRVNVRQLTDVQALRISAQENLQRNNMTPLEECETMLRLRNAGESVEDIRITFGYASTKPVVDRLLVAESLHTEARDHLDAGNITLAQAIVIARAPGEEMQKTMLQSARNRYTASDLSNMLTRGQFLLSTAKFDVEKSGLQVKKDLFDVYQPYFESKAKAMEAQLAWAEAKAEKLRKKGKHPFVDVACGESYKVRYQGKYETCADTDPERGLVLFINETTGKYEEMSDLKYKASKQVAQADGTTKNESVREMPTSAYEAAHIERARALRHSLLGQSHVTLALTVHALIAHYPYHGKAAVTTSEAWQGTVTTPQVTEKLKGWQDSIGQAIGTLPTLANLPGKGREYRDVDKYNLKLYDHLLTLSEAELLDLLNVLVAARIYEPVVNHPKDPPAPLFRRLAEQTQANEYLKDHFTLSDEWLKRYPRHELVNIAQEAGLGHALVEDCATLKDMRGRILEHLPQLKTQRFLPKLVQFPTAPNSSSSEQDGAAD